MQHDWSDWYWIVGGDTDRAFSSAAAGFVPATAPGYTAWLDRVRADPDPMTAHLLAAGRIPTRAPGYPELFEALRRRVPAVARAVARDFIANGRLAPGQVARWLLADGVTVACEEDPLLDGTYPCDAAAIARIAYLRPPAHPIVGWKDTAGAVHRFPSELWERFALGVTRAVRDVYSCEAAADAGLQVAWPTMRVDL